MDYLPPLSHQLPVQSSTSLTQTIDMVDVKVKVVRKEGNIMPMANKHTTNNRLKFDKIIAVPGRVKPVNSSPYIDVNLLSNKIIGHKDNKLNAAFFNLPQGVYTFFIVRGQTAYLNHFEANGDFKTFTLSSDMPTLIIKDDRFAYF